MNKFPVISATYENGVSMVTIKGYQGRYYTGVSACHPDEQFPNEFFGGEIAELRAIKLSLKDEAAEYNNRLKALRSFYFDLTNEVPEWKRDRRTIKMLTHHIHDIAQRAVSVEEVIKNIDKRQDVMIKERVRFMKNKYGED